MYMYVLFIIIGYGIFAFCRAHTKLIRKTQHFGCQHKVWSTERRQEIFQGEAHHCFSLADRCTTPIFGCFQPRRRGVDMRPYRSLSAPFVVYVAAVTARVMRFCLTGALANRGIPHKV